MSADQVFTDCRVTLSGRVCTRSHGGAGNAAEVYGHWNETGSCTRVGDLWVTDLRREDVHENEPAEDTDTDPFEQYQMYTPAGNAAVAGMVQRVLADAIRINATKSAVVGAMQADIRDVERVYPEIRDTAPREAIYDVLDRYYAARGWTRVEDGSL